MESATLEVLGHGEGNAGRKQMHNSSQLSQFICVLGLTALFGCRCDRPRGGSRADPSSVIAKGATLNAGLKASIQPVGFDKNALIGDIGDEYTLAGVEAAILAMESDQGARSAFVGVIDRYGNTLLHRAANGGSLDLTRRLVALGVDVNAINTWGFTALDLVERGCRGGVDCTGLYEYLKNSGATWNWYK